MPFPGLTLRFASAPVDAVPDGAVLAADEQARLARFGSASRRMGFALGRTAARTLLAEHLGVGPAAVPLVVAADGGPTVAGHPWHVSIAHTAAVGRAVAVAGIAPQRLGVDLEALRPRRADLYRFLLHPDEYGLLDHFPDRDTAHVTLWAIKEAVLKGGRTGFRRSPKALRLTLDLTAGTAWAASTDGVPPWAVRFQPAEGCILAVAVEATEVEAAEGVSYL